MHLTAAHKWRLFIFAGLAFFLLGVSILSAQEHNLTSGDFIDSAFATSPTSKSSSASGQKQVRIIYLIPSDSTYKPEYALSLKNAARHLQQWYQQELGDNLTFRLNNPVVEVHWTNHESQWYSTNPNGTLFSTFWNNVLQDGFLLTGGRFYDPDNIWLFYIDAFNACGQCGGCGGGGVAVISANDLRGFTGVPWKPICPGEGLIPYTPCRYVGGMGHELGHALGLPHPPGCEDGLSSCDEYTLMWWGYITYPDTDLTEDDKAILRNSPFISALEIGHCPIDCDDLVSDYTIVHTTGATICQGDSIMLGGQYQSKPDIYCDSFLTSNGCDSVVYTWLTVLRPYEEEHEKNICEGDSMMIAWEWRSTSGTYYDTIVKHEGCHSVITTHLKVHPPFEISRDTNICLGDSLLLGGEYRKVSGTYMDSLLTVYGCDSIITTHLSTLPLPEVNLGNDTLLTTYDTLYLDAGNSNCEFSWCDGSSEKSLRVYNLDEGLHPYWVKVTDENGCAQTDTILIQVIDATFIPLSGHMDEGDIRVFPNPVDHTLHIEMTISSHYEFQIYSGEGKLVQSGDIHGPRAEIQLAHLQNGLYFLTIKSPEFSAIIKLVKW